MLYYKIISIILITLLILIYILLWYLFRKKSNKYGKWAIGGNTFWRGHSY